MPRNVSRPVRPKLVREFLGTRLFALAGLADFAIQTRGVAPSYHITGFQPFQTNRDSGQGKIAKGA